MKPYTITITGIDGCGKSTVIHQLIKKQKEVPEAYQVLACTNFHDTPNAPFSELSQGMDALSQYADIRKDPTIKYVALYLKMTLFGAIEQFFADYYQPNVLITERHPLVGSLVYGNLYLQMNSKLNLQENSTWNESLLEEQQIPWASILYWFKLENKRLGRRIDFWELPAYLVKIQQQQLSELIPSLTTLFRTTLPQKIIHFQIEENIAATRVGQHKPKEIHESEQHLIYLHQAYLKALKYMEKQGVAVTYLVVQGKDPNDLMNDVWRAIYP